MAKVDSVISVPLKETNNYTQGHTGAETRKIMGPAVGKKAGNATTGGGINRATKG